MDDTLKQMKCLEVNDRLTKVLDDVDKAHWVGDADADGADGSGAAVADGAGPPPPPVQMSDSLLSEAYSNSVPNVNAAGEAAAAAAAAASASSLLDGTGGTGDGAAAEQGGIGKTKSEDEFDSFFNERQTGGGD